VSATAAAPAPRRQRRVTPDINITPLVDVVLVLLIIFMVVAPQMEQDIPITLPGIFNPDPDAEGARAPTMLSLTREGRIYIESQAYDVDGALAALAELHASDPLHRLALRADAGLRYADVRDLFFRIQDIGFPGVSLMVSHKYKAGMNTVAPAGASGAAAAAPADDADRAPAPAPAES
jgi:biopolymer transport protein ExbD